MQILSGLILLAVLIVFHELGHFLFAKMLGVRVLTFSLGFGPTLWSKKHKETEYRIAAIPLGGYIRMFGESAEEELSDAEKKISFMHQPIWRKSLIAFAGPLFNFILPVILFFCILVGNEQIFAPKIGTLVDGGAAQKAGLLPGDEIKAINGEEVDSFSGVAKVVSQNPGTELKLLVARSDLSGDTRDITIRVTPESKHSPNMLEKDRMVGRMGIMPAVEKPVVLLSENSPLNNYDLKSFDEVRAINGQKVDTAEVLMARWKNIKSGASLSIKRDDQEINITISGDLIASYPNIKPVTDNRLEDGADLSTKHQEDIAKSLSLLARERKDALDNYGLLLAKGGITKIEEGSHAEALGLVKGDKLVSINGEKLASSFQVQENVLNGASTVQVLGVLKSDLSARVLVFKVPSDISENLDLNSNLANVFGISVAEVFGGGEQRTRQVGAGEALSRAFSQTVNIGVLTAKSIWMMVKGDVPASQIGGPIMLFGVAGQAAEKGLSYYIFIMCLLSVNLGLLNLLPIPALDGGHLLLFSVEAIQRKPLTAKTRAFATQIGVAIVLFLMGFAIFNDLSRLFS